MDFNHFRLFQFVSVSLLYNLHVSMIRNTGYGVWNFQVFMFQFVSKRFETIESVDLEIFSLFQFVSVGLLHIIYMFQCFKHQIWVPEFSPFLFQFVSKCFETSESVDFNHFHLFQFLCFNVLKHQIYLVYNFQLFMFQFVSKCFKVLKHQIIMGSGIFTFLY